MISFKEPLKLRGAIRNYEWGKIGSESAVARLVESPRQDLPYAELWFGANKDGSATVIDGPNTLLNKAVVDAPVEILGRTKGNFKTDFPFLFKVLSIRTALSIQAHPDQELASELNQKDPKNYPDRNHKPELALALTRASMLHGFRADDEVREYLKITPEILVACGEMVKPPLARNLLKALLGAPTEIVQEQSLKMVTRLLKSDYQSAEVNWIRTLAKEYSQGDLGFFCFFLLQLVILEPGEAVFAPANVPHAYLEGDLLECMADSDNVVRAGFTPKYKDRVVLSKMLERIKSEGTFFKPAPGTSFEYYTGCKEFSVRRIVGKISSELELKNAPGLVFSLSSQGTLGFGSKRIEIAPGEAWLLPACVGVVTLGLEKGEAFVVTVPE